MSYERSVSSQNFVNAFSTFVSCTLVRVRSRGCPFFDLDEARFAEAFLPPLDISTSPASTVCRSLFQEILRPRVLFDRVSV